MNLGPGLERDSENTSSIAIGFQGVRFVNNRLCLDVSSLINNTSASITMDIKERLELNYSPSDSTGDSTGKIWMRLSKHFVRSNSDGILLNIDDQTIKDNTSTNINEY